MSAATETLAVGRTGTAETTVERHNTADAMGSGQLPVFATPAMLALMELAACNAVQKALAPGASTVGAEMRIRHIAPTPVGMRVTATATLTALEGRKLTFACEAYDATECVGTGTQVRYIVDDERFRKKANDKRG